MNISKGMPRKGSTNSIAEFSNGGGGEDNENSNVLLELRYLRLELSCEIKFLEMFSRQNKTRQNYISLVLTIS